MKSFFGLILVLFSAGWIFGQSANYPNELKNLKLIDDLKLKDFRVGITPQDTVEAAFGKDCESEFCAFNEKWSIKFYFFPKGERQLPRDRKFPLAVPIIRYDGRLRAIVFKPLQRISLRRDKFGKQFSRQNGTRFEGAAIDRRSKLRIYQDRFGLRYETLASRSHLGSAHDLLEIEYGLPPAKEAVAFELW